MFVRTKTTPNSPKKAVQIVESLRVGAKVSQKIVRHVGFAEDGEELKRLKSLAEVLRAQLEAETQPSLFAPEEIAAASKEPFVQEHERFCVNLRHLREEQRVVDGIHTVYGSLFDALGFDRAFPVPSSRKPDTKILRDLVLARMANPQSKHASVRMLEEDFGVSIPLHRVYRMMDGLNDAAIERIQAVAAAATGALLPGPMDVLFYDATTLYFEAFEEDDLRRCGMSKDMKGNQPQVVLALFVTTEGLPMGYEVFPGNTFEGRTLIPALHALQARFEVRNAVVVADAGMLSEDNLRELERLKLGYIVAARLKTLDKTTRAQVCDVQRYAGQNEDLRLRELEHKERRLIVGYSATRARKDAHERERSVEKLRKQLTKSKSTKSQLGQRGNRKFLRVEGESQVALNEEAIAAAAQFDGLRGVYTNTDLSAAEALSQYTQLWQVEQAFRITKHDLRVRPVFHWKPERVKAHIAMAFIAYTLAKHLEYRVHAQYKELSIEGIRRNLMHAQTSLYWDERQQIRYGMPNGLTEEAKKIYRLMGLDTERKAYIVEAL